MTKRMGPPPLVIPERLINHLQLSYEKGEEFRLEGDSESADMKQFISICKLYAKRVNKSFRFRWEEDTLIYQLKDKRAYTSRTGLPREK